MSSSLTKQAALLMAGRMLSLPLTIIVPMILVRKFSVVEFGEYKQIFLIFNVFLPVIDLGISNSLFYFIPKYPSEKGKLLFQTIVLQIIVCILCFFVFLLFKAEISDLFTSSSGIARYIPLLGLFVILWHLSNIVEVILIAEKKAFLAAATTFFSEFFKSISIIAVAFYGGKLEALLYTLVFFGLVRLLIMGGYLLKKKYFVFTWPRGSMLYSQLRYAIPFGLAVIVNGFVANSHQYIVSLLDSPEKFAIFSVGCFQLPLLGIVVDSVAKASLVRMSELRNHENALVEITQVVSNSFRKLWIIFFPIFIFLFINAEEFITILFTRQYLDSVEIFRIFIFLIPMSAILVQHVPRAFAETRFILVNNVFVLFLSVALCYFFYLWWGISGVAAGFIIAHFFWKVNFIVKCKRILKVNIFLLIPFKLLLKISIVVLLAGLMSRFLSLAVKENMLLLFILNAVLFFPSCIALFWRFGFLEREEKEQVAGLFRKLASSLGVKLRLIGGN